MKDDPIVAEVRKRPERADSEGYGGYGRSANLESRAQKPTTPTVT